MRINKIVKACYNYYKLAKLASEQFENNDEIAFGDLDYWNIANLDIIQEDFKSYINGDLDILTKDLFMFFNKLNIPYKFCGKKLEPGWGVSFDYNKQKYVVDFGRKDDLSNFLISEEELYSPQRAIDFIDNLDYDIDQYIQTSNFNEEFWNSPANLYHATSYKNKDDILKNGLMIQSASRGLSNKYIGDSVFTSMNPDAITDYGSLIFEINTSAMKSDSYMPEVSQEPDIEYGEKKTSLAYMIGLEEYNYDYESGMEPDTVIVYGSIPAKYLRIYEE